MRVLAVCTDADVLTRYAAEPGVTELTVVSSMSEGLARLREHRWSMMLLEVTSDSALLQELLPRIAKQTRVVALARNMSLTLMVESLKQGAFDVLPFPPPPEAMRELFVRCRSTEGCAPAAAPSLRASVAPFVGDSPGMLSALMTAARVAPSSASVLITGESGTGKECLARLIHEHSTRAKGPYVAVNCAAIPENLLESELFGVERGAFTGAVARRIGRFERASGGTLFLDEIGDMTLGLQAKILRCLQEREVERVGGEMTIPIDVRVIAATNRELEHEIAEERFRSDLYHRLAVVELSLPPLRERGNDIRMLAEYFVGHFAAEHRRPVSGIAAECFEILRRHAWPGNVRQLRNVIERAVLLADGPVLLPGHLPSRFVSKAFGGHVAVEAPLLPLDEVVRSHILRAIALCNGQQGLVAELLGIHRNTLRRKLQEYGETDEGRQGDGSSVALADHSATACTPLYSALRPPRAAALTPRRGVRLVHQSAAVEREVAPAVMFEVQSRL